ncbi:MAG: hypothetical protein AAF621_02710 [Pseudomonadota bacterium]
MPKFKVTFLRYNVKYHKIISWIGGVALLIFALSGMTHPLMSWTGPKATAFFPPQAQINAEDIQALPYILEKYNITSAHIVKIVPFADDKLLQVTQDHNAPRRYFDLGTRTELEHFDAEYAKWLARYYTGLNDANIADISFQTEFNSDYPWVNRLLPVYKVQFAVEDQRTAYIYTELSALGSLSNNYKKDIQTIFRAFHTWSWLDNADDARVWMMMIFLISLTIMSITGIFMLFMMPKRKIKQAPRRWHRYLSYAIFIPLLFFSVSGIYHLLQMAYMPNFRGLKIGDQINLQTAELDRSGDWISLYKNNRFNALSLIEGPDQKLLYRLSLPKGKMGENISRQSRYNGVPFEKSALYIDAKTGKETSLSDRDMAIFYAKKHRDLQDHHIKDTKIITHFGPHYDFRNKRLPAWQINTALPEGDMIFIDPATGVLIDRLINNQRYETYSFSFLHKWNFLRPLIGPKNRDILIVLLLSFAVIATILGYMMLLKRTKRNS